MLLSLLGVLFRAVFGGVGVADGDRGAPAYFEEDAYSRGVALAPVDTSLLGWLLGAITRGGTPALQLPQPAATRRYLKPRVFMRLVRAGALLDPDPAADCYVCLGRLGERGPVAALPCGHSFCGPCAGRWLAGHDNCPTCRFKFPVVDTDAVKEL